MKMFRRRRTVWRSYRRLRQVLFAFSAAAGLLGGGLLLLYVHQRHRVVLWLGGVYLMLSGFLWGLCKVLSYLDDLRRRKQHHISGGHDLGPVS